MGWQAHPINSDRGFMFVTGGWPISFSILILYKTTTDNLPESLRSVNDKVYIPISSFYGGFDDRSEALS